MAKEKQHQDARHKRHTVERTATLRKLPLFAMLQEDELIQLADQVKFAPFVSGDIMLEQGEVSSWLFVLVKGEAEMLVKVEGRELPLGTLNTGDFFGELSLLTGDPEETLAGLNTAAGFLRSGLFKRLHIHTVPTLHFVFDRTTERAADMNALISKAVSSRSKEE